MLFHKRRQYFKHQVFAIPDAIRSALDNADLVVQPFHEAERDFVVGVAVAHKAIPVPLDHGGKVLKGLEALPA